MADYINSVIQPDLIIWTGDSVPHTESTEESFDQKKAYINWVNQYLLSNFSTTPIYPTTGNHDYLKTNFEDFTKPDQIYKFLENDWGNWLDD